MYLLGHHGTALHCSTRVLKVAPGRPTHMPRRPNHYCQWPHNRVLQRLADPTMTDMFP